MSHIKIEIIAYHLYNQIFHSSAFIKNKSYTVSSRIRSVKTAIKWMIQKAGQRTLAADFRCTTASADRNGIGRWHTSMVNGATAVWVMVVLSTALSMIGMTETTCSVRRVRENSVHVEMEVLIAPMVCRLAGPVSTAVATNAMVGRTAAHSTNSWIVRLEATVMRRWMLSAG